MEYVGGLPLIKMGHDYLFVIIDIFSKIYVVKRCKKTITQKLLETYFFLLWVHFKLPSSIILDKYSRFLGMFWTILWEKLDTQL